MRRVTRRIATAFAALACAACSLHNTQNALDPSGPQAARIAGLWWLMLPIAAVVWVIVVAVLLWGAARRRGVRETIETRAGSDVLARNDARDRRITRIVAGAVIVTAVTLFLMLVADFRVGQALTMPPSTKVVPIKLVGHQFWWEVQYPDSIPNKSVTTANEVHIPVGTPVVMELRSFDVIHSMWVPSLTGKKDLMPGYTRSLWFRADTPGVYRGQCAEFCGLEHAKMGMLVIAQTRKDFDAWLTAQRDTATPPTDSLAQRGKTVFEGTTCVMCHAISGTVAGATTGPDLTHLASRRTIAAGTLQNTDAGLYAWISDPQRIKPGVLMPATKLSPRDMQALVAYLRQLK
jgi:cytochrome c oxidase subunit II